MSCRVETTMPFPARFLDFVNFLGKHNLCKPLWDFSWSKGWCYFVTRCMDKANPTRDLAACGLGSDLTYRFTFYSRVFFWVNFSIQFFDYLLSLYPIFEESTTLGFPWPWGSNWPSTWRSKAGSGKVVDSASGAPVDSVGGAHNFAYRGEIWTPRKPIIYVRPFWVVHNSV